MLRARQRVKWSLTALIATATVSMAILEEFFGLWRFTGVERFTYFDLLTLIVPAILLSIAAMTVLPDDVPHEGLDLAQYYMDNRRLLYLLQALWVFGVFVRLLDLVESVTGRTTSTLELAAMFPWQTVPLLCIFALLCWSSSMRVQLIGVMIVFALVNGTIADRSIAVRPVAPLAP